MHRNCCGSNVVWPYSPSSFTVSVNGFGRAKVNVCVCAESVTSQDLTLSPAIAKDRSQTTQLLLHNHNELHQNTFVNPWKSMNTSLHGWFSDAAHMLFSLIFRYICIAVPISHHPTVADESWYWPKFVF